MSSNAGRDDSDMDENEEDPLMEKSTWTPYEKLDRKKKAPIKTELCAIKLAFTCGMSCALAASIVLTLYCDEYRVVFDDAKCEYYDVSGPMQIEVYCGYVACVGLAMCVLAGIFVPPNIGSAQCIPFFCATLVTTAGVIGMGIMGVWENLKVDCDPFQKTGPCAEECPEVWDDIKDYAYMSSGMISGITVCLTLCCWVQMLGTGFRSDAHEKDLLC